MKSYKLWVAVDENGDFYVFVGEKPKFDPKFGEWRNDSYHYGSEYIHAGRNKELKKGSEAIKEIEFELPTEGEEEEAPKGMDLYVAVDQDRTTWLFSHAPTFWVNYWWCFRDSCARLGHTSSKIRSEDSLRKVHLNIPYEITFEK